MFFGAEFFIIINPYWFFVSQASLNIDIESPVTTISFAILKFFK